jgi:DNA-binding NtrC family response regulator
MSATAPQPLPLLVIEDERAVMDFIRLALERHGYSCRTANSAAQGIVMLEAGSFNGVISDMRTPGGASGADVHAWITRHRPELRERMLFITGDTVNEETLEALNHTGVPYIEKPFRVKDLITNVERIFGRAQ